MGTYFPIFINLEGKRVQVFGGGNIATRRVAALLEFGAEVHVVAPEISGKLEELAQQGSSLTLHYRPYLPEDLAVAELAIAATNDEAVNDMVYRECRQKGIPVNVASDKEKCDFFFPGIAKEGDITVGVTAGGKDHKKAAQVTAQIRELLKK